MNKKQKKLLEAIEKGDAYSAVKAMSSSFFGETLDLDQLDQDITASFEGQPGSAEENVKNEPCTFLFKAFRDNQWEIFDRLLQHGASPFNAIVNRASGKGNEPRQSAAFHILMELQHIQKYQPDTYEEALSKTIDAFLRVNEHYIRSDENIKKNQLIDQLMCPLTWGLAQGLGSIELLEVLMAFSDSKPGVDGESKVKKLDRWQMQRQFQNYASYAKSKVGAVTVVDYFLEKGNTFNYWNVKNMQPEELASATDILKDILRIRLPESDLSFLLNKHFMNVKFNELHPNSSSYFWPEVIFDTHMRSGQSTARSFALIKFLSQAGLSLDVAKPKSMSDLPPPQLALNKPPSESKTPLMLAIEVADFGIVKTLVELGANINAKNTEGLRPLDTLLRMFKKQNLSFSEEQKYVDMLSYFLDLGIDVSPSKESEIPLLSSIAKDSPEVEQLLTRKLQIKSIDLKQSSGAADEVKMSGGTLIFSDECNEKGQSSLMLAMLKGEDERARKIISPATYWKQKDNVGFGLEEYALLMAARFPHLDGFKNEILNQVKAAHAFFAESGKKDVSVTTPAPQKDLPDRSQEAWLPSLNIDRIAKDDSVDVASEEVDPKSKRRIGF